MSQSEWNELTPWIAWRTRGQSRKSGHRTAAPECEQSLAIITGKATALMCTYVDSPKLNRTNSVVKVHAIRTHNNFHLPIVHDYMPTGQNLYNT